MTTQLVIGWSLSIVIAWVLGAVYGITGRPHRHHPHRSIGGSMSNGKHNREHQGDGQRNVDPKKLVDPNKQQGGGKHGGGNGGGKK